MSAETTPATQALLPATPDEYLIRKGGAYYRPNAAGYTNNVEEAGRYSLEDAIRHSHPNGPNGPRDGIDYMPAPARQSLSLPGDVGMLCDFADKIQEAAVNCCTDPDGSPDDLTSVNFTGEEGAKIADALHRLAALTPSSLPATQEDAERSGVGDERRAIIAWLMDPTRTGLSERDVEIAAAIERGEHRALSTPQRQEYDGEAVDPSTMSVEMADLFGLVCKFTRLKAEHDDMLRSSDGLAAIERAADKLDEIVDAVPMLKTAFAKVHAREEKYRAALAHPAQATPSAVSGDAGEGIIDSIAADIAAGRTESQQP